VIAVRRRCARRYRVAALALLAATSALAGCADSSAREALQARDTHGGGSSASDSCPPPADGATGVLAEARRAGTLRVGVAGEAPYGFLTSDGEVRGQAPQLAQVVLCRLGVPAVEGRTVDFGALIPALNSGRFDVIAAGMTVTAERAQQVLFTDPYFCEGTALAVARGNPLRLSDVASVARTGARLGVLRGAVEDRYASAAGVPAARTARFDGTTDLFAALLAGHVDAAALTEATVHQQTRGRSALTALPGFVPVIDGEEQLGCGAYAFRLEDEELRRRFDEVLHQMKRENAVLPLLAPHGFSAESVQRAGRLRLENVLRR
jgi:polar amino acid transport system substrate-binding protein